MTVSGKAPHVAPSRPTPTRGGGVDVGRGGGYCDQLEETAKKRNWGGGSRTAEKKQLAGECGRWGKRSSLPDGVRSHAHTPALCRGVSAALVPPSNFSLADGYHRRRRCHHQPPTTPATKNAGEKPPAVGAGAMDSTTTDATPVPFMSRASTSSREPSATWFSSRQALH